MFRLHLFALTLFTTAALYANVGDWRVYQTIDNFWRIEQLSDTYYMLNGNSLFSAAVGDEAQLRSLTRVEGLNGTSVYDIVVNASVQKLAVVYSDGNIDLIDTDGEIDNLPDFANHTLQGDRSITGVGTSADTLWVQTGFGALVIDLQREVIRCTLYADIADDSLLLARCEEVVSSHQNSDALQAVLDRLDDDQGPKVLQAAQMSFAHNRLYVLESNYEDYTNPTLGSPAISILNTETDTWGNYDMDDLQTQAQAFDSYTRIINLSAITPDPSDPSRFYVSGHKGSGGIFRIDGSKVTALYNALLNPDDMCSVLIDNDRNLSLYTWVSAMTFDDEGNMWYTNGNKESDCVLRCIAADGTMLSFPTSDFIGYYNRAYSLFGRLRISQYGSYKWVVRTFSINSAAVCIYDDNGTLTDMSDDKHVTFSTLTDQDGNQYNPSYFTDLVEDREGAMWLLTKIGPFVIDDQVVAFNKPGVVRRIKVPRTDGSGLADYLLGEVSCRCMVVDAANRKWIGTDASGLYLLSPDGLTTLAHFTTDNSPLLSNRICSLCMDDESGMLYIGMAGGVCAYQTDVLQDVADNSGLYAYPNPVRSDYTGDLTIAGFRDGSTITVSDALHHVVMRQRSEGAVIRWNLEGNDGRRVRPGVYYIDAIEEGGSRGKSFKILVM